MDFINAILGILQVAYMIGPILGVDVRKSLQRNDNRLLDYKPVTSVVQKQPVSSTALCLAACIDTSEYIGMFYKTCEIDGYQLLTNGLCIKVHALDNVANHMYNDSTEYCISESGRLARVDTRQKYIALRDYMLAYTVFDDRLYYIDGVRNVNNEWEMSDGSIIPTSAIEWAYGEPHTDECLVIWTSEYKHGDTWCTNPPGNPLGFICERVI